MESESDRLLEGVKGQLKSAIAGLVRMEELEGYDKPFMLDITKALGYIYSAHIHLNN